MSTVTIPPQERNTENREHDATTLISRGVRARPLFDPEILKRATKESFVKLNPKLVAKNPVMFVVEVGAALTTVFVIKDALAKTKTDAVAHKILPNNKFEMVPASSLRAGDTVYCEAGILIPGDGEVIEGIASVDESVITGE